MNRQSGIMWVHLIRLLSIVAVLWVHSTAEIFFYDAPFGSFNWWVADIYDSLVRICVPLFFMISGYLLLGKAEPTSVFLKKRAAKVAIPLLVWSAFYLLWVSFWEYAHPSHASSMDSDWLKKIHDGEWLTEMVALRKPAYYHLWFLYAIMGLYLITPLLRLLVQKADGSLLRYFVCLFFIGATTLTILDANTDTESMVQLNLVMGDILYFVLGYLLGNITLSRRLVAIMAAVAPIAGAVTIIGTYYLTAANHGELQQSMWWESTPNIIAMSVAAFILLRHVSEQCRMVQTRRTAAVIEHLSTASFGIYLIHPLFLYAFGEGFFGFRLTAVNGNPIVYVPILVICAFAASYVATQIMQRIPVLRHTVP
jgi:surface polysaccharide O-acyltransferase-like enzyme